MKRSALLGVLSLFLLAGCGRADLRGEHNGQPFETVIPTEQKEVAEQLIDPMIAPLAMPYSPDTILIPAGSFMMGAEAESGMAICEQSRPGCKLEDFTDEGPSREVFLETFWIDRFEVTNANYQRCVESGDCHNPVLQEFYHDPEFSNHPVVYVSWYQAERFCNWAGGSLPTEAQWEKAARGTDERIFPWGNDMDCGLANLKGCTEGLTMEVGVFPDGASPYGVMDMAGNVGEWVADWYHPDGYDAAEVMNPTGPDDGELKVARGGSWKNPFSGVRTTNRTANFPEVFSSGIGFRCVYHQQP